MNNLRNNSKIRISYAQVSVTWINDDTVAHTVTSGTPGEGHDGNFDSGLFISDSEYTVTFDEFGTFDYYCYLHPWMLGQVTIGDSETQEMMDSKNMSDEAQMVPISYDGTFVGVGDGIHDVQGDVYTIPLEGGSNVLRLENFQSTNGPDLFVYLSTDDKASEFINLGALKANNGNQNYEIPDDTDLDKYDKVLIWCKSFSVLFGSADLSS